MACCGALDCSVSTVGDSPHDHLEGCHGGQCGASFAHGSAVGAMGAPSLVSRYGMYQAVSVYITGKAGGPGLALGVLPDSDA